MASILLDSVPSNLECLAISKSIFLIVSENRLARLVPEMFGQRATGSFPQSMDPGLFEVEQGSRNPRVVTPMI